MGGTLGAYGARTPQAAHAPGCTQGEATAGQGASLGLAQPAWPVMAARFRPMTGIYS